MSQEQITPPSKDSSARESEMSVVESIEDSEDYIQRRRLKEILDKKQAVARDRKEIDLWVEQHPHFSEVKGRRMLRASVEEYLQAVEPLARRRSGEIEQRYWNEISLGSVDCMPPADFVGDGNPSPHNDYLTLVKGASPRSREFNGLLSVLNSESPLEFEFSATAYTRSDPTPQEHRARAKRSISREVLTNAMRICSQYIAEVGFELDTNRAEEAFGYWSDIEVEDDV